MATTPKDDWESLMRAANRNDAAGYARRQAVRVAFHRALKVIGRVRERMME